MKKFIVVIVLAVIGISSCSSSENEPSVQSVWDSLTDNEQEMLCISVEGWSQIEILEMLTGEPNPLSNEQAESLYLTLKEDC